MIYISNEIFFSPAWYLFDKTSILTISVVNYQYYHILYFNQPLSFLLGGTNARYLIPS